MYPRLLVEGSGNMHKFSIGDRVICLMSGEEVNTGDVGTVIEDHDYPCVRWDISRGRMYEVGDAPGRNCWAVRERYLELVEAVNKSTPVTKREW